MDDNLIKSSIEYHGEYLMDHFNDHDLQFRIIENQDSFKKYLMDFVISKKKFLFEAQPTSPDYVQQLSQLTKDESSKQLYASIPPLEIFMEISKTEKRLRFFEHLNSGDILVGSISSIDDDGFSINLLAVEVGKVRDISNLKLMAFCPFREVDSRGRKIDDVLSHYSVKDKVKGCVIKVKEEDILISFLPTSLPLHCRHIKLGIIADDDLPLHYSRTLNCDGRSYEEMLQRAFEFQNPSNTTNLAKAFNLNTDITSMTLMTGIKDFYFEKDDYANQLRWKQSKRLADKYVAESRRFADEDRIVEAMQMTTKALDVHPQHIDALLIRAYLYVTSKSYKRAIEDLEEAFHLDPEHLKTKKSLLDTIYIYQKSLVKEEKVKEALIYVKKALSIDPHDQQFIQIEEEIKIKRLNRKMVLDENERMQNEESINQNSSNRYTKKNRKTRLKLLSDSRNLSIDDVELSPESKKLLLFCDAPTMFGPTLPPQQTKRKRSLSVSSTTSSTTSLSQSVVLDDAKNKTSSELDEVYVNMKGRKSITPENKRLSRRNSKTSQKRQSKSQRVSVNRTNSTVKQTPFNKIIKKTNSTESVQNEKFIKSNLRKSYSKGSSSNESIIQTEHKKKLKKKETDNKQFNEMSPKITTSKKPNSNNEKLQFQNKKNHHNVENILDEDNSHSHNNNSKYQSYKSNSRQHNDEYQANKDLYLRNIKSNNKSFRNRIHISQSDHKMDRRNLDYRSYDKKYTSTTRTKHERYISSPRRKRSDEKLIKNYSKELKEESKQSPKETLQDMEQFLKQLKDKKKEGTIIKSI